MNPVLTPRNPQCTVCKSVAELAHIAIYIWDEDGKRIPAGAWRAGEYLRSIGQPGNKRALHGRVETHIKHVEAFLARPSQAIAPMQLVPIGKKDASAEPAPSKRYLPPERTGPSRWVDVQQNAMEVGNDALAVLEQRIQSGTMEDPDIISVAKLGASAAAARGALEAKGRRLNQVDELIKMAAGGRPPQKVVGPGAK